MPHRFEDAEAWAKEFDDPARDAWQKPDEVVSTALADARIMLREMTRLVDAVSALEGIETVRVVVLS